MKCEYCGTWSDEPKCPSCGAPRTNDPASQPPNMLIIHGMSQEQVDWALDRITRFKAMGRLTDLVGK